MCDRKTKLKLQSQQKLQKYQDKHYVYIDERKEMSIYDSDKNKMYKAMFD